jgi:hypothetical protein
LARAAYPARPGRFKLVPPGYLDRTPIKGAKMATKYEVVPSPDGGWRGEALRMNARGGEVRVHGRDGRIRSTSTINKTDPLPPRG